MGTELWHSDIKITESAVQRSIENQFPMLAPLQNIKLIGEGWDNKVFLINNEIIFRFPRRRVAIELIERENKVLDYLNSIIKIAIPNPKYIGHPDSHYPHPFHGYHIIPGKSGCTAELTPRNRIESLKPLALFLKQLHSIQEKQALSIGAKAQVFDRTQKVNIIDQLCERIAKINDKQICTLNTKVLQYEIEQIKDITLPMDDKVLVHGDLYSRHIMFQKGQLTGIIDWGDVGINNRAVDLMIIFSFYPQSNHEDFIKIYGKVESNTWRYARFLGLYSAITVLLYGHDIGDTLLAREAVAAIQRINPDILPPLPKT